MGIDKEIVAWKFTFKGAARKMSENRWYKIILCIIFLYLLRRKDIFIGKSIFLKEI